jgi:type I restriction enzyme S subunit
MEKYSSYKDSGVKWLGEIPSHWETIKSKYIWQEQFATSENGTEELLSVSQYDGVTPSKGDSRSESLKGYKIVKENDLVINIMLAWLGGLGVSKHNGIVSPAYCTYKMTGGANPHFLHYLYKTPLYLSEFARHSTGVVPSRWRMYTDDFGQVLTLLPPLSEQNAIASYLDSVTTQIDTAIEQQKKMIELLNERKQIIINNAVTKGLDPNVKMKDSGVDWIGEIPEGWEVCSLKKVATIILGKMLSNNPTEKYPYLCAKDVHYGNVDLSDLKMMYFSKEERERYRVQNGDMLIVEGGAGAGGSAVFDGDMEVFIQNSIMIVRGNSNMDNRFICYFFQTINQKGYVEFICNKATIPHFTKEKVGAVMLPIPPIEEQMQIVNKIKSICEPIDNAINAANKQISLLQERKQIIINEVVTGKVKVS